jgi:hypothetical protein
MQGLRDEASIFKAWLQDPSAHSTLRADQISADTEGKMRVSRRANNLRVMGRLTSSDMPRTTAERSSSTHVGSARAFE